MAEILPQLTNGMLGSDISPKARNNYERRVHLFCGEVGDEIRSGISEGRINSSNIGDYRERFDTRYFKVFGETYNVPGSLPVALAYQRVRQTAIDVMNRCYNTVFPDFRDDRFRTEVALSPSPLDFYYYLLSAHPGTVEERELRINFILHQTAAASEARFDRDRAHIVRADIERLFATQLFTSTSNVPITVFSEHDPKTNTVKFLTFKDSDPKKNGGIWKSEPWGVRSTEFGLVQPRIIDYDASEMLEKIINKAIGDDKGVLNAASIVPQMGYKLIVLLPQERQVPNNTGHNLNHKIDGLEHIAQKAIDILVDERPVMEITPDHKPDSSASTLDEAQNKRYRITEDGQPFQLQLEVSSLLGQLNRIYEVGGKDPVTGLYQGQAEELYRLRVIVPIARILIENPDNQLDADSEGAKRSGEIAEKLLALHNMV